MLRKIGIVCIVLALASFLIISSCKKKIRDDDNDNTGTPTAKAKYPVTGNEGTITGVVKFDGTPPTPKRIDMSQDANCASAPGDKMTDDMVVTDGKLENVYIYLQGGSLDKYSFPVPSEPVVLDQK